MVVNSSPQVFLFLSQILRKKIIDAMGRPQGRVSDLVVAIADLYPPVTGVLFFAGRGKKPFPFPLEESYRGGGQTLGSAIDPRRSGRSQPR
jgi:hypothetical protein